MVQKHNMLNKVAVVGASGVVGRLVLKIMHEKNFPAKDVVALSSNKSAGQTILYAEQSLVLQELDGFDFSGVDLALFCVPTDVSITYVPKATSVGCVVIDNSNYYRTDPQVPLVIPEVNGHTISGYKNKNIIANANCAAIQMLMALKPLHDAAIIKRIVVSTYQSVSGIGFFAMNELKSATESALLQKAHHPENFARDISFNVVPKIDKFNADGNTIEEWKMQHDTQRILNAKIPVSATCVRVPVMIGHSEAVNVEFEKPISADKAKELLLFAPGVIVSELDEDFATPKEIAGTDAVYVSRIRKDQTVENGLNMWIVSDNLRKGAALNTVQIAECWLSHINS
jgi:aspartate-semialdehyde dehydrogenase